MEGYRMRQGTIYRKLADSACVLLIHHNPMQLESLILTGDGEKFDAAHPAVISADTLIALRRSGEYEDRGDLPAEEFRKIVSAVMSSGGVTEEVARMLKAVLREADR